MVLKIGFMLTIMNRLFTFYFCVGLMLCVVGCGKDEDVRRVVVKNSCSELVNNPMNVPGC